MKGEMKEDENLINVDVKRQTISFEFVKLTSLFVLEFFGKFIFSSLVCCLFAVSLTCQAANIFLTIQSTLMASRQEIIFFSLEFSLFMHLV